LTNYRPLAAIITNFMLAAGCRDPDVQVVPIIIGARGAIPSGWSSAIQTLKLEGTPHQQLAARLSALAIEGSTSTFYAWKEESEMVEHILENRH
jgi:hypothetical protein